MEDLKINKQVVIPGHELSMTATRSGGPGGQHANKTSSRVRLEWNLADSEAVSDAQRARLFVKLAPHLTADGIVQVTSSDSRSQHRNRDDALVRLAELVRRGLQRPKPRKKTRRSKASHRRRLEHKKRRGEIKKSRKRPKSWD